MGKTSLYQIRLNYRTVDFLINTEFCFSFDYLLLSPSTSGDSATTETTNNSHHHQSHPRKMLILITSHN